MEHQKLLSWMARDLERGPFLAGDAFSNADAAVIPHILRLELLNCPDCGRNFLLSVTGGPECEFVRRLRPPSSIV